MSHLLFTHHSSNLNYFFLDLGGIEATQDTKVFNNTYFQNMKSIIPRSSALASTPTFTYGGALWPITRYSRSYTEYTPLRSYTPFILQVRESGDEVKVGI